MPQSIFAAVNISDGNERACYEASHHSLVAALPTVRQAAILLDAPLDVLVARVNGRNRASEVEGDGIPVEYLARLQRAHHEYYEGAKIPKRKVSALAAAGDVASTVAKAVAEIRAGPGSPASIMDF